MQDETIAPLDKPSSARGCLTLAAVFLVISIAGALVTLTVYVLVVEQWELIRVRREFGYEMIIYAPLAGLVLGSTATLWAERGGPSSRRVPVALYSGAFIASALLLLALGSGSVM